MSSACWTTAADGRYWIDIELGGRDVSLMLDTGIVDPLGQVGFEVDSGLYDALKRGKRLSNFAGRSRRDSSGRYVPSEIGWCDARLIDPGSRRRVGPVVRLAVYRGVVGVPSRVGLLFFHHLTGCRVVWDLDARLWCVEYP